jgi:hypothetical protein
VDREALVVLSGSDAPERDPAEEAALRERAAKAEMEVEALRAQLEARNSLEAQQRDARSKADQEMLALAERLKKSDQDRADWLRSIEEQKALVCRYFFFQDVYVNRY